jgi:hypothetical protein
MDIFAIRQGEALPIAVQLSDDQGNPVTKYTGLEPLAAAIWPGGNLPAAFMPAANWVSGPAGQLTILVTSGQTAGLDEGRYTGTLSLTDPVAGPVEVYNWSMDVLAAPGTATTPPVYCQFSDLLTYGKGWVRSLQSQDEDAGFATERGRARSWLDDLVINAWEVSFPIGVGDPGYGAVLVGQNPGQLPSVWIRQQLAAGGLVLRDLVVEIVAKKALAFICEGQMGASGSTFDFAKLGRWYSREANELVKTLRAEIDADGNGYPQFAMNLGMKSMRG